MEKNRLLECGKIVDIHGVQGMVRLESWCDSPRVLASLKRVFFKRGEVYDEVAVLKASCQKEFVLMALEGVADMDAAAELKETVVFADRQDLKLKPGSFFIEDLIGLPVLDADSGAVLGKLTDVVNRGASDLYEVETPVGTRLVPAVKEFIIRVDPEKGVFIRPIEGLLD